MTGEKQSAMKVGDVVGLMVAQDPTFMLITSINGDKVTGWDLMFEMSTTYDASRLHQATKRDLESRVGFAVPRRNGSFSIQELADEARAKFGLDKAQS